VVNIVGGIFLVIVGILVMTNYFTVMGSRFFGAITK